MPLDAAQLAPLIEGHAATLRLWIRSRCPSPEDVVQEAFCRLAVQDPPPDNPVAWLYSVSRNLAENQRRNDKRRQVREQTYAQRQETPQEPADRVELLETLAAVEALPPELHDILVARVWGQLTLEEIAKLCGLSTATTFRRYQTALQTLREKLASNSETR
jgi:RNA polymerase sigma-70 factor (ECF subfamily)